MSTTALLFAFALILVVGLLTLIGIGDVWSKLFKGPSALLDLIDRRYPPRR